MSDLPPIVSPAHGARTVRFDHGLARNLASELRATGRALTDGATDRDASAERARTDWQGNNRDEFDDALSTQGTTATGLADDCATQRGHLVTAWEDANELQRQLNRSGLEAEQEAEREAEEERERTEDTQEPPARPTPPVR